MKVEHIQIYRMHQKLLLCYRKENCIKLANGNNVRAKIN